MTDRDKVKAAPVSATRRGFLAATTAAPLIAAAGHAGAQGAVSTPDNRVAAGHAPVAGIFGVHRFHHVVDDDSRCVSAEAVTETTFAFQRLMERALG